MLERSVIRRLALFGLMIGLFLAVEKRARANDAAYAACAFGCDQATQLCEMNCAQTYPNDPTNLAFCVAFCDTWGFTCGQGCQALLEQ